MGDTLAQEHVNFFGIGQQSTHYLTVNPGVADPMDIFIGSLELHTHFYDTLACSWQMNDNLCATGTCTDMVLALQNWGGALVTGDFEWELTDSANLVVDSGSFTMIATEQYWSHTVCVPPGNYVYNLTALTPPSGGGPHITASNIDGYGGAVLSQPLDWFNDPAASLQIPFFLNCATGPNNIQKEEQAELTVSIVGTELHVSGLSDFSRLKLVNAIGQVVYSTAVRSDRIVIPSSVPNGTYVLLATGEGGSTLTKKLIKP
jgi:hypothetical protein